jgi:hypothetical protein
VRRRGQKGGRPEDAFLRALKARGRPPARDVEEPPTRAPVEPVAESVPAEPARAEPVAEPASAQAPPAPDPGSQAAPQREGLDSAAQALAQVREEAERRLAEARAAIERERAARVEAERQVQTAREQAELEHARLAAATQVPAPAGNVDAAPNGADAGAAAGELEQRIAAVAEAERRLREERERWEAHAERLAHRRAAELAEAERRIEDARARLREEQAAAHGREVAAAVGQTVSPEPPAQVPELPAEPEPPAQVPAPPPAIRRPAHTPGPLARLRALRGGAPHTVCATCGRELAGSRSEAAAAGWEVNRKGSAICDECQLQGWHFPDGAALPLRSPVGRS